MAQRGLEKNRITELRELASLTQEQLAERVGSSGNTISRLEMGKTRLSHDWMVRIARQLGCKPGDLIEDAALNELGRGPRPQGRPTRDREDGGLAKAITVLGSISELAKGIAIIPAHPSRTGWLNLDISALSKQYIGLLRPSA
jgi:transcriptional regulator with XRE-family HTH domain